MSKTIRVTPETRDAVDASRSASVPVAPASPARSAAVFDRRAVAEYRLAGLSLEEAVQAMKLEAGVKVRKRALPSPEAIAERDAKRASRRQVSSALAIAMLADFDAMQEARKAGDDKTMMKSRAAFFAIQAAKRNGGIIMATPEEEARHNLTYGIGPSLDAQGREGA